MLTKFYALRVYLVLFNYTEEGKGITISQIEDRLEEMFGERAPSKNVTNEILREMEYGINGKIQVKKDNHRRYYLTNRGLSIDEVTLLSEVILQSKSLNEIEKDDIGMKLGLMLGEENMYQYKKYKAYGNLVENSTGNTFSIIRNLRYASVDGVMVGIKTINGQLLLISPYEVFSRDNILYLLYADENKNIKYIEINEISEVRLTDTKVQGLYDIDGVDWDILENPIAYINGERRRTFVVEVAGISKEKAKAELKKEFGTYFIKDNASNNRLNVDCFYPDLEKFLFKRFDNYKLVYPTEYVGRIKEQIEKMFNNYK